MRLEHISNEIIGQESLVSELTIILNEIIESERKLNILIIGPSGSGKSHIIKIIANILHVNTCVQYDPENFSQLETNKQNHFIDEVHLLQNPEAIYGYMDSGQYCFFLSTNEYGTLKEPLINRCITLFIQDYSDTDLAIMARVEFIKNNFYTLPNDFYKTVAWVSRGCPRTCKSIVLRLSMIFRKNGVPKTKEELDLVLLSIGIDKSGFTKFDKIYLSFLEKTGRASLKTISLTTNLDEKFIRERVEPFLIKKGLVKITPRGRIYDKPNYK